MEVIVSTEPKGLSKPREGGNLTKRKHSLRGGKSWLYKQGKKFSAESVFRIKEKGEKA